MPTLIERVIALSKGVPGSEELKRIVDLPKRFLDLQKVPDLTPVFRRPGGSMSLFPIQSAALFEIEACNGGLFPIGVGHGKTLVSLLASEACQAKRPLLLVPPSLKDQLLRVDIPRYGEHFSFQIPHVVSYSELSNARTADALERLDPDLIVADEAHCLKRTTSARTKRFLRFARSRPALRFVALSGTMTAKSLRDYAHLSELALDECSPLPRMWGVLEDWCAALDPGVEFRAQPGQLLKLCEDKLHVHFDVRERFRCRLVSSYGVVATEQSALGTSLVIRGRTPCGTDREHCAGPEDESISDRSLERLRTGRGDTKGCPRVIQEALQTLRETWVRPDGEELEEATRFYQVAYQLAQGFFLRWAWPQEEVDHAWLEARAAWHQEVRAYLGHHSSRAGRDSPLLLARAAEEGTWSSSTWGVWSRHKHKPLPPTEVVWLSTYLAEDAAAWLKDGGIVWVNHPAFGEKVSALSGCPFFGAGQDREVAETTALGIVLSLAAHGTGKNLQRYSRMLFSCVPGNNALEQAIARCHRPGQEADEVTADIYLHVPELRERFEKTLQEAEYVERSTGQRQKLLIANRVEC